MSKHLWFGNPGMVSCPACGQVRQATAGWCWVVVNPNPHPSGVEVCSRIIPQYEDFPLKKPAPLRLFRFGTRGTIRQ